MVITHNTDLQTFLFNQRIKQNIHFFIFISKLNKQIYSCVSNYGVLSNYVGQIVLCQTFSKWGWGCRNK